MPDSLAQLEEQRSQILRENSPLGDFRRGSVTTIKAALNGAKKRRICRSRYLGEKGVPGDPGDGQHPLSVLVAVPRSAFERLLEAPGRAPVEFFAQLAVAEAERPKDYKSAGHQQAG